MDLIEQVLSDEGLKIPGRSKPLRFSNYNDLSEFLKKERDAWELLNDNITPEVESSDVLSHVLRQPHQQLDQAIASISSVDSDHNQTRHRSRQILAQALQSITNGNFPLSTSLEGKRLMKLAESDLGAVAGVLLSRGISGLLVSSVNPRQNVDIGPAVSAISRGLISLRDPKGTIEAERQVMADLALELESNATKVLDSVTQNVQDRIKSIESFATRTDERLTEQQERFHAAELEIKNWISEQKNRLKNLEETLTTKLATDDAVILWETAGQRYKNRGWGALAVFTALAITGVLGVIFLFDEAYLRLTNTYIPSEIVAGENVVKPSASTTSGLALGVLITFPIIVLAWGMRLASRTFNHAGASRKDAEIRAALTKTYLNLAADPSTGIQDAERVLVLNALFRPPGATGDDDTLPPNLIDVITKARDK